jgi:putative transposase
MLRSSVFRAVVHYFRTLSLIVFDLVRLAFLVARSHRTLAAENLFLRKQLALFQERKVKPRRADDSTRWMNGHPEPNVPLARGASVVSKN